MSLALYHAVGSCGFAPLVALEAVGAEYELRRLDLARGDQRDPRYIACNPHGRVPTLVADGVPISEVIAVLTYIAARFPQARLLPTAPLELGKAMEVMSWIASSVHVALAQVRRPERYLSGEPGRADLAEVGRQRFTAALDELDALSAAGDSHWLTGEACGAVGYYAAVVRRWAGGLGMKLDAWPAFDALTARILAQPAARRALAKEEATPLYYGD